MPRPLHTLSLLVLLAMGTHALAHFQELIPSTDVVTQETGATIDLALTFTHPLELGPAMEMFTPTRFGVLTGGETFDLLGTLEATRVDEATAYLSRYDVQRPGDHVFFVEPAPYWEPAEGAHIIHYTKVVVNGYGLDEGWDERVGFPIEIEPLVRPYDLFTGNLMRGLVLQNGEPVPFAEVEVEWRNDGTVDATTLDFTTQVIKAGPDGVFSYAMPRSGWWGFAALVTSDETLANPSGEQAPIELGGLLWVHVEPLE